MKILHLSPNAFGADGIVGGGERYVYELAKAQSIQEEVILASYVNTSKPCEYAESLRKLYIKRGFLFFAKLFKWVLWADVIHCHQIYRLGTDWALILGKLFGKKVYVTDLGGWGRYSVCYHYPLLKHADGMLAISEYAKSLWQTEERKKRVPQIEVISGGINPDLFQPAGKSERKGVLYVGRIVSHKGIDQLLDAVDEKTPVSVIGRVYDEKFFKLLKQKSEGKSVTFYHDIADAELVSFYRNAAVCVQLSVYEDVFHRRTEVPELLGLSALEAMACGTPVIVTQVASLPEIVKEGETGFTVPARDLESINHHIRELCENPSLADHMGAKARAWILERFTWDRVAKRCFKYYAKGRL